VIPRTPAAKTHILWAAKLVRAAAVEAVDVATPVAVPFLINVVDKEESRVRVLVGRTVLVAAALVGAMATLSSGLLPGLLSELLSELLLEESLAVAEAEVLEITVDGPLALVAPPPNKRMSKINVDDESGNLQACWNIPRAVCWSSDEQDAMQL